MESPGNYNGDVCFIRNTKISEREILMKKSLRKHVLSVCLTAVLFCAVAHGTALAEEDTTRYVPGTRINGLGVSQMTTEEAKAHIESFYQGNYTLRIKAQDGKQEILHDTDINYRLVVTGDLNAILEDENAAGRISGPDVKHDYSVEVSASYDEELLKQEIQKMSFVKSAKETKDAYISSYVAGEPFTIIPEVQGNDLDLEKLTAAVKGALAGQAEELDLVTADCYRKVQVTKDNEELKNLCDVMNRCAEMVITYNFGDSQETLDGEVICQWLKGSSGATILVDEQQAAAYVKTLADKYDTYGKPHAFRSTVGENVTVTGPYGWQMNQAAETAALISMIQTGQTQSREPAYTRTAASRSGNDYGATFVELDLKNQHLYLYENGTLIIDTPFVSGNVAKGWTTPPGIFGLTYKERDRVLRGAKLPDGTYEYESPVSYWMPFNGGIGLHDANWRSKFGGEIYKNGGSHGCVNLPPKVAPTVYEHVYKGMPIICHYGE